MSTPEFTSVCLYCMDGKHDECSGSCKCLHVKDLSVSHSRVEAFLRCTRQEYYGYGRKLQRIETSIALSLGTAIHSVLEALYRHVLEAGMSKKRQRDAYPEAVKKALSRVDELYAEGFTDSEKRAPLRLIIEKYLEREPFIDNSWREDDDRQWLVMAVEKEFSLVWDDETNAQYPFVIDLIMKDPDGYTIVVDNKGVYDLYSYDDTQLMPQIPKYIGALRALGYKVGNYGVYNMLRTRPAPKTKERKPEEWSFALSFDISATRVQRSFMEQVSASRIVHELDSLTAEDRDLRALRVNNKDICNRICDFRDLCVEELRGGNTAILLKSEYQAKKKRPTIAVSPDVEAV